MSRIAGAEERLVRVVTTHTGFFSVPRHALDGQRIAIAEKAIKKFIAMAAARGWRLASEPALKKVADDYRSATVPVAEKDGVLITVEKRLQGLPPGHPLAGDPDAERWMVYALFEKVSPVVTVQQIEEATGISLSDAAAEPDSDRHQSQQGGQQR